MPPTLRSLILAAVIAFVLYKEVVDMRQNKGVSTCSLESVFELGVKESDTCAEIADKTQRLLGTTASIVIWRRAAIVAIMCATLYFYVIATIPSRFNAALLVGIVTWMALYWLNNFTAHHTVLPIVALASRNLTVIEQRCTG